MPLSRFGLFIVALSAVAIFSACETSDDNAYAKAQACLDKAASTADGTNCIRMVNGLSGEKASLIRCSATYLRRGFTKDSFITAFDKIKNPTPSMAPMAQMMDVLAFSGSSSETGQAADADASFLMSECATSKSPGMIYMAMCTQTATLAKAISSNLSTALNGIATPSAYPSDAAAIGNAAIIAQSAYCANNSSADAKLCSQLNQAVSTGGGNPTAVGQALAGLIK